MIPTYPLRTRRLELIPSTSALLAADSGNRNVLANLLGATVPSSWPPALLDDTTLTEFVRMQEDGSDPHFCSWYWILTRDPGEKRTLIGSGGIASMPEVSDTVLIGYSVLEEFQGQGFATEALECLLPEIFQLTGVKKIYATTFPELKASIRVLQKNGFIPAKTPERGFGMEEGTLAFVLNKPY
jgi:[ribosomal protein S5]-alanine N-acetyltransferase